MKHYDRETKKYITEEERDLKLKKRSACKGGRDHDYVELLPWGANAIEGTYQGDPQPYYDAEDAIQAFTEKTYVELEKLGILVKYRTPWRNKFRQYACTVCKKRMSKEKV